MKHKSPVFSSVLVTIREHPLLSAGLLFTIAGATILGILPPLVLETLINRLTEGRTFSTFLVFSYFFLLTAAGLFDASKESLITVFGQKITRGLRHEMCAKLSRLPAAYFQKNEPGVTASRFVNDVDTVEALFTSGIIGMAADLCKVISILAVIFVKSKGLGILMMLVTPLLYALTRLFQKRMLSAQLVNRAAVGRANNHVPETIKNIRMIRSFHKEAFMEKKYGSYIQQSYHAVEKANFYDAVYSPIVITISSVLIAVMMIFAAKGGAMQAFFGMSAGTAVAVIAYVGKVFEPLESIGMEIQNIQSAVAGVYRINEFLREEERKMPPEDIELPKLRNIQNSCSACFGAPPGTGTNMPAAELDKVSFGYEKEQEILHDVDLTVMPGENVTLIGRTGAGKSTIFKLLLGLYRPWNGRIRIFGMDADQIPDRLKRKLFGYVEQSFPVIPGTIADQITLKSPDISAQQIEKALKTAGLWESVNALEKGWDTPYKPGLFSQGQLQLLSIARAVAAEPAILLLDEITANLDSVTEKKVLAALQEASKRRTVISISHRLNQQAGGRRFRVDGKKGGWESEDMLN
ncbi:ABC transporter ATP-binding protein [Eisenbergiella porci]|uniref:ABC transporter ATP-binding protein n=1 Tax=Eisenbergiella porci TaxID=2652274 RepID=UPI002A7F432C|nr:ABC transporter ATP-binding protein [Eisenbergiella porci]